MAEKVSIIIEAVDKASGVLGGVGNSLMSIGGAAAGAAVAGIAAVGAAAVGVGLAGAKSFMDFEGSMREVYTLMPGISAEAMGAMSKDVLDFANEFGTLPNEVIPSLYQAISAGVPADNVFNFLETAQKAAIGGVTDLETAVDGISSAVNAYGSDILSAAQASDIMFTAVRLGKTDFEQLSGSLFQVLPTASALGVGLDQVGASLATLTAQGVPTSVATTQMRQLFIELSKEGGKASGIFKEMAGTSFKDFVASGGNVQDALRLMEQAAAESGIGIQDLFGSVEAGAAAMGLTGTAADSFAAALAEMTGAAGATEAAYDTMNGGFNRSMDRLKAFKATALITIGDALSPLIGKVLDAAEGALPAISDALGFVVPILESLNSAFEEAMLAIQEGDGILGAITSAVWEVGYAFGASEGQLEQIRNTIKAVWARVDELRLGLMAVVAPIIQWVQDNIQLKDVLAALGLVIGAVVISALASLVAAIAPVMLAGAALAALVSLIRQAWENDWGGIQGAVAAVADWFQGTLVPIIQVAIPAALQFLSDVWQNVLLPAITAVWNWMSTTLIPFLQNTVFPWLQEKIPAALETLRKFWENILLPGIQAVWNFLTVRMMPIWEAIGEFLGVAFPLVLTALQGIWQNVLLPAMTAVWEFIKEKLGPIFQWLKDSLIDPTSSAFQTLGEKIQAVADWIRGLAGVLSEIKLPDWMTPGSPTPWEIGLIGVRNELQKLSTMNLPAFGASLNAVPSPAMAGGMATGGGFSGSQTIINIDARGAGVGVGNELRETIKRVLREEGRTADMRIRER